MNSEDCIRALDLAAKAGNTLMIRGPSGIGKTSITEQYARAKAKHGEFFYGVFNGATANLADTIGFLLPKDRVYTSGDGREITVPHGQYTYPYYFMDKNTRQPAFMYTDGLLVIEEYGQAQADVKRARAPLIHSGEKRIGDYNLPENFQVCLLSNRTEDRSGVGKDFDFVINRRVEIEFTPELEPWLVWAAENDVEPVIMAYATRNAEKVFQSKHPEKQGPWCTPRSLVDAGKTIRAYGGDQIDFNNEKSFLMQNLIGSIGNTAIDLMVFLKLRHALPPIDDILSKPDTAFVPDSPDAQMIIAHELAHKADRGKIDAMMTYMQRMPKSFAVTFSQTLLKRKPDLVGTRAMGNWALANHQLMAAISRS